jgi:hypothetical protein
MGALPPLRIVATYYDDYRHRQHFRGFDNKRRNYCTVEVSPNEFKIYSFYEEPECPIRADIDIIEVDKQGNVIRQIQEAQCFK